MSASHDPLRWIDDELAALDREGLLRELPTHAGPQTALLRVGERELVNFGSNDYLALAADPRLAAAAAEAALAEGCGAGASPLVTGHSMMHARLEAALAAFEGSERALVFSSGYAANVGTIAALAGRGDVIFADEKNHASMIDGCRLSRADVRVYPHCDARALESLLAEGGSYRRRLIVSESVFSMDGDLAPLAQLVELAERFDALLVLDEAHATGVFGPCGRGLAEDCGVEDRIGVRIGTLSKALGTAGGFVCGSGWLVTWLVNRARPYVFSTALPPATCAAAIQALEIVRETGAARGGLLREADRLRERLAQQGWDTGTSASQIIPIRVGEAAATVELSARLREHGLLVPAIRPPSVPRGESLLRISLTLGHTPEMIDRLCESLAQLAPQGASRSGAK